MTYTKKDFGKDLLNEIKNGYDAERIARWADNLYYLYLGEIIDDELSNIIQNIASMSFGVQFLFTESELFYIGQRLLFAEDSSVVQER